MALLVASHYLSFPYNTLKEAKNQHYHHQQQQITPHTMKTSCTIFLLILFLASYVVFISITMKQPDQFYFHGSVYEVRVINGFTNNSSTPLIIWCRSNDGGGDMDLGGRALQEGDDFGWSVEMSFWRSRNLFICGMKWDKKRKSFEAFRDSRRCGALRKCSWLVKEDGFYFSNDEVHWTKHFSWP